MDAAFNAYHRWLGIPLYEQPPHHYRLLGLGLFESNPDVIASAADRQMAHVKSFHTGKYVAESQKLLNEISAARICLLNKQHKTAYDANLKAKLEARKSARSSAAQPASLASELVAETQWPATDGLQALGWDAPSAAPAASYSRSKKAGKSSSNSAGIAIAVAVVVAIVGGGAFLALQSSKPAPIVAANTETPVPKKPVVKNDASAVPTDNEGSKQSPKTDPAPDDKPKKPVTSDPAKGAGGPKVVRPTGRWNPADDETVPTTSDTVEPPTKPNTPPAKPDSPTSTAGSDNGAPKKFPIPDDAAREKAGKLVQELFAKDLAQAKSASDKSALAHKLLDATASVGDDTTGRYVLTEQARTTAIEAGDTPVAMDAVDDLVAGFAVDGVALAGETLTALAPQIKSLAAAKVFMEKAFAASEGAATAEKFGSAQAMADLATAMARKSTDPTLLKEANTRAKQFAEQRAELERLASARHAIAIDSNDPEANLTLGRYLALIRNDWEHGLPYLAKVTDATIKAAALADLQNPKEASAQATAADNWWNLATPEAKDKAALRQRASYWYMQALPSLAGLEKARVEKRLDELSGTATGQGPQLAIAPFNLETARERQLQWGRLLKVAAQRSNSVGMKLSLIPPGEFMMGSPSTEEGRQADEGPAHKVKLTKPFYMSVEEVSVAQFTRFVAETGHQTEPEKLAADEAKAEQLAQATELWKNMSQRGFVAFGRGRGGFGGGGRGYGGGGGNQGGGGNPGGGGNQPAPKPPSWKNPPFAQTKESPVVYVTWEDAVSFCKWLSKKEGMEYRLPTEAEWEFAARAGTTTRFYHGDDLGGLGTTAWYLANARQMPHPGGQKKGNQFGLVDMLGNVWEWCADEYAPYTAEKASDPNGGSSGKEKVVRGGGFAEEQPPRCAERQKLDHKKWDDAIGFRVVALPATPKE